MGRSSSYSEAAAFVVCERIAEGLGLEAICKQEGLPDARSVYRWLAENEEFRQRYARAREEQAETFADQVIEIADTEEDPNRARVRIDARKWAAAKHAPKKYGDKSTVDNNVNLDVSDPIKAFFADIAANGRRIFDKP